MPHTVTQRHFIAFTSSDVRSIVGGVEGAAAAVAGNAEVTLPLGLVMSTSSGLPAALRRKKVVLAQVEVMRKTGASGTNYQPQVYDASGAATTAWATKYLGGATAPGTRFGVTGINQILHTNTDGNLYFKVNGDAADTFDYIVWFEVLG